MATEMIFTWNLNIESFNKIRKQSNLIDLCNEFEMRKYSLSRSLLIWTGDGSDNYSLSDIDKKKFYHIVKRSDAEIEVWEDDWDSVTLRIPPLHYDVHGTFEGFIDWLKLTGLNITDFEKLKRPDLSHQKRDFEIVYDDLLAVYELLRGILMSPRESFLDLPNDDVQKIRTYLGQFWELTNTILRLGSSISKDRHTEISQQILQFYDEVKQQLGQVVTHLKSKKSEQLETQVNTTVAEAMEELKTEKDLLRNQRQEAEENESARQKEFAELKNKLEDELTKETVSKHKKIFAKQADEHRRVSLKWLIATGVLIVAFGAVFYWLFETLRLGGTEWVGVLQNVFTKGFLLTLIYFVLNRSIKNYSAQKHLEVVNRHRQNALDTFDDFFESAGNNPETRHAVLIAATDAIFDANQSGYLSAKAKGSDSANPIQQVVRTAFPGSSSTRSED